VIAAAARAVLPACEPSSASSIATSGSTTIALSAAPWKLDVDYPEPIVEHAQAAARFRSHGKQSALF